jgi:DNA-binding GntR family transcriptional regulator
METVQEGYRTMAEIAMAVIKKNILSGLYPPGIRLIPAHMEKELNLGRVAIREALQVLAINGLVQAIPNKGVVVANPLDLEEMKEVYDIRVVLEGKAFELALSKISDQEIAELKKLNQVMAANSTDSRGYFELNRKFHLDLYKASGSRFLCQLISQIHDRISLFRSVFPYDDQVIKNYVGQHDHIIHAIKARNVVQAQKLMIAHLREGFYDMKRQIQQRI